MPAPEPPRHSSRGQGRFRSPRPGWPGQLGRQGVHKSDREGMADELPLPSEIVRVDCCPATMVVGAKLLLTLGGWPGLTSRLAVVDAPLLPTLVCKAPTPMCVDVQATRDSGRHVRFDRARVIGRNGASPPCRSRCFAGNRFLGARASASQRGRRGHQHVRRQRVHQVSGQRSHRGIGIGQE